MCAVRGEEEVVWVGERRKLCGWERGGSCVGGREKGVGEGKEEGVCVRERRKVCGWERGCCGWMRGERCVGGRGDVVGG